MSSHRRKLSGIELIVLIVVAALMMIGIIAALVNKTWFEQKYVVEDGFIEDITLIPLAVLVLACIVFLIKYSRRKNIWFFLTYLAISLGSFFILGEEISWGQRIFHFRTSEYFEEHNSQDEMNIHNLVIDGEKLNKIIFTDALVAGLVIYLLIFPVIYKRNDKFKRFIDRAGFPIPRLYQVIACALVFGSSFLTLDTKGAELLEFGGCFTFMLIVLYPFNSYSRSQNANSDSRAQVTA